MARPGYAIDRADLMHAKAYLGNRLRNYSLEFSDEFAREQAYDAFLRISRARASKESAGELNSWCDEYLSDDEWRKLKESIRKRRQRWAGTQDLKSVTMSAKAHRLLSELATRDSVTLSKALETYLPKILNRPIARTSKKPK